MDAVSKAVGFAIVTTTAVTVPMRLNVYQPNVIQSNNSNVQRNTALLQNGDAMESWTVQMAPMNG